MKCTLQRKPHHPAHSQLLVWCPALSQIDSIIFIWRKDPWLFANHSIICLSHTNHRSKVFPLRTTERSPGAPRSRHLAVHFLPATHMRTVQTLQYVVKGKTFPLRSPRYMTETSKIPQSLVPTCPEAQQKLRAGEDCYTKLVTHSSNVEHWLTNGVQTAEQA